MQARYIDQEAVKQALNIASQGLQSIYQGMLEEGEQTKPVCLSAEHLVLVYETLLGYAHTYEGYNPCQCEENVQECGCCH